MIKRKSTAIAQRVVLMANYKPGLEVCRILREMGDEIVRLYVADPESELAQETIRLSWLPEGRIFEGTALRDPEHVEGLRTEPVDFIITVYWPYLLKQDVFGHARRGTVNFHPALLPINRGWYPHVHSLLDGSPCGVTLHQIDAGIDTGPIWSQRVVSISPFDTAKTLYDRLQTEIVLLFRDEWPKIRRGESRPYHQDEAKAVYHKKAEIGALDEINLSRSYTGQELVNLLRARSFGELGFAFFEDEGQKVYLNLRLSPTREFE